MTNLTSNSSPSEEEQPTYSGIVESTVEDLFSRFVNMNPEVRINIVSAVCLAKALSEADKEHSVKSEETKLEYLKEYGRNERAVLKSEHVGLSEDDDPVFSR